TDWPEYRGPWKNGNAQAPGSTEPIRLPLTWSETQNIAWKTAIPHEGHSTPVILGGQIWLTTATADGRESFAICVDAQTGEIRFNERVFENENPEPLGNNINSYASPSPVIEPGRVYVHFGSYGTACLDTATAKPVWERRDLPCRHFRGPGSSPLLYENLLILSFDGIDQQYIAALDKNTGGTVWKTNRSTQWKDLLENGRYFRDGDYHKAFCTPLVIEWEGKPQLISLGACAGFAYDPYTGAELWKTHHDAHSASPRPLFGNGLLYVTTGHGQTELWAIRPGGQGDITDTHVAWRVAGKEVPKQPSPVLVGELIYMVSNEGIASCVDALTGEMVWSERIGGNFMASPIYADGRIYASNMQGETTVMKAGRTFEILAENRLESGCLASPAVSGKALFLRTKTHLYRLESR
ncbi:MAG TPA: PQQ-binding-like beta-propeller repeat protein, partial [Candidatus Hydrogenedentes bacterium]|nr:PQQ-binding-like beta-propeller repeat protein [Candidatus Hydrogenedentota bacterium]